jgi:hypothetical protein
LGPGYTVAAGLLAVALNAYALRTRTITNCLGHGLTGNSSRRAVGTGVFGLSMAHSTESIGLITGSHLAPSGLLAIDIDAGMVTSELAELTSRGTKAGERVRP